MNIGAIIGGGIFVVIGIVAGLAGSALVVSMVVAAVVSLLTALSYAELAAWIPLEGSIYEYGYRLLSPAAGFLGGWMWMVSNLFTGAAVALGLGYYVAAVVPGLYPNVVGAVVAVGLTALNYVGIKESARLNDALVVAKLAILGFFVAYGLLFIRWVNFQPFQPLGDGVLYGAFYIFFAYGGFGRVAVVAEEIVDARREVPRAIMLSLAISTVYYIAVGLVAVGLVGAGTLSISGHPLAIAMGATGSSTAVLLISVGGIISTTSVLLTSILGVSRLGFAMSRRGDLPRVLSVLSPRFGTPGLSVVVTGTLITALVLLVDLTSVIVVGTFALLFYYAVANLSASRLKRVERRYPIYVPALGMVTCLALLVIALFISFSSWVVGLAVLGIGYFYYRLIHRRRS